MAENKKIWNKIGIAGTYKGHPSGPFSMTADTFREIAANFAKDGIPVPIDFDHEIENVNNPGRALGQVPAAGWVRGIEARPDGTLWAQTDFLPETRSKILSKQYSFCSPAIRFSAVDPVSGKNVGARLSSLACTNKPFLRALPPLQANDATGAFLCSEVTGAELVELTAQSAGYAMHQNQFLPAFRRMLGLDDLSSPSDMLDKVDRLSELCDMADGDPSATVEGVNLGNYIPSIRQFMAMPANTTLGDLLEAVSEMIGSTIDCDADMSEQTESTGAELSDALSGEATQLTTCPAPVTDKKVTINMTDVTISMADHEAKVTAAVASAVTAEVAKATAPFTLQLTDVRATLATTLNDVAAKDAKIVELTDKLAAQANEFASARVEEAFETYKEVKKLSDDDKAAMPIVLATNPALFDKLYPKISPAKSHLLRTITASDTSVANVGKAKVVPALSTIIAKVKAANPALDYDSQFNLAMAEHATLMSQGA